MSVINTNFQALAAARNLERNQELLGRSLNRLSSGNKIVRPGDDAGGLAVSEKIDAQNHRVRAASTNVQNASSFVQTADSYMAGMTKILTRMSELSAVAADPTKSAADIALTQVEFTGLQDQLRATIGGTTTEIGGASGVANPQGTFNGRALFGPNSAGITVNIGSEVGQNLVIPENNFRTGSVLSLISQDSAGAYTLSLGSSGVVGTLDGALQQMAGERAKIGGVQSNLSLSSSALSVESENLSAALSSIRDVDVAQESTALAKYNILTQAGTSMLTQANVSAEAVLKLLQGG
jgi:flagellin